MPDFKLTTQQGRVVELLVRVIGLSGVHKRPEQGDSIVLDILPAEHAFDGSFCIRVAPDGHIDYITDEEAGLDHRPDPFAFGSHG